MTMVTRQDVLLCMGEYQKTLQVMRIRRRVGPFEDMQIARAIQAYGVDLVRLAIVGARNEKPTEKFNPSEYLSLKRILSHDNVEKFANLGATTEEYEPQTRDVEIPEGETE